jgi:cholesterol transport system auxiliary component
VQRLKSHLARAGAPIVSASAGAANVPLLRIEADDFMQVFETPTSSSAHVMLRAAVMNGRVLVAQKTFSRQVAASTPDAAGGARALAEASDALIVDISDWLLHTALKKP